MNLIDMTDYGPVLDRDGEMDCSSNLGAILAKLFEYQKPLKKREKVKIFISIITGPIDSPRRDVLEKIYTFGHLCRLYKKSEGVNFNPAVYKKHQQSLLEAFQKQGEKSMAWAGYAQYLHVKKLIAQEKTIELLSEKQQTEKREQFEKENGPSMIRIG